MLYILYINDFYSRVELINSYDSICDVEIDVKGECFGGVVWFVLKINELCD